MPRSRIPGLLLICTLAALRISAATQPPVPPPHSHDDPVAFTEPRTLPIALQRCKQCIVAVRASIDGDKLEAVHVDATILAKLASRLPPLAKASTRSLADDVLARLETESKELSKLADQMHALADARDGPGAKEGLTRVVTQLELIESLLPATYICPMRCEESKTYAAPGTCPVCHMKLKKVTIDRYSVDVRPTDGPLAPGQPAQLRFEIKDPFGAVVNNLEVVHEKKLHLLMVSKDLSWFAHEHPVLQPDGTLLLTWSFRAPGEYTLFHDFTPGDVGMQVVPVTLTVPGAPPAAVPLDLDTNPTKLIDGYRIHLDTGGPITIGGSTTLTYTISTPGAPGQPDTPISDLEPYLGALGHLIIVSQDRSQFVHSHPREGPSRGPQVDFSARFTAPGRYKAWAQFQHKGKVITAPFVFDVGVPSRP